MRNQGKEVDLDHFWKMYNHVQECKEVGKGSTKYCRENGITQGCLLAFKRKLELYDHYDKNRYKELLALGRKYTSDRTISKQEFLANNNISEAELHEFYRHIAYLNILQAKQKSEETQISFMEITAPEKSAPFSVKVDYPASEVLPQQNDLEISITQGIKVCIAPNIDSMKIIKIIELLKDL